MTTEHIAGELRGIAGSAALFEEKAGAYTIHAPFFYDDGDGLTIHLCQSDGGWYLTDHGQLSMRLSYDLTDEVLDSLEVKQFIAGILASQAVVEEDHELRRYLAPGQLDLGWAQMIQAMLEVYAVRRVLPFVARSLGPSRAESPGSSRT